MSMSWHGWRYFCSFSGDGVGGSVEASQNASIFLHKTSSVVSLLRGCRGYPPAGMYIKTMAPCSHSAALVSALVSVF